MTFKDALIRNSISLLAADQHDVLLKKSPQSVGIENKGNKKSTLELTLENNRCTTLDVPRQKRFEREEIVKLMREYQGDKTQTEFAAELGVSRQFITEIYKGRKFPGEKLLSALGITIKTVYERTA